MKAHQASSVTHLLKISFKSHFLVLEYKKLLDRETQSLYNDTIILSQSKLNLWIDYYVHVWNKFTTSDKNASKAWFLDS